MSSQHEPLPPVAPELARLLEAERPIPALSAEARARIRAALRGGRGGAPGPRGGGGGFASGAAGNVVVALVGVLVGVVGTLALQRGLGETPVGAPSEDARAPAAAPRVEARSARARASLPHPTSSSAPPAAAAAHEDEQPVAAPAAPPTVARVARGVGATDPPQSHGPSASAAATKLGAERELLDAGRAAIVRGHPAQALAAVERHRRDHPEGLLAEEREVLAVQALSALGRAEEAGGRAAAFRRRWPASMHAGAVGRAAFASPSRAP